VCTSIAVVYADQQAVQYVRGKIKTVPLKQSKILHALVWTGLALMIITGVFLTVPSWSFLKYEIAFYVKMIFVVVLILNGLSIDALARVASERPFKDLEKKKQHAIVRSGVVSFSAWVIAAAVGYFFL